MTYKTIVLDVSEGVATLTLNRPERKNALDLAIREEIADALAQVRGSDAARALVLTGAGGDFCAGGDIRAMAAGDITAEAGRARLQDMHAWLQPLLAWERPLITAVDGAAYGAGFGLALAGDFILATPRARFCASFMRVGLVPDGGLFYTLPRMVGLLRAKELMLSARELDAATAQEWGMVSEVVPAETLAARARAIAASFVNASPAGIGLIKSGLARSFDSDLATMLALEAAAQGIAFSTGYHRAAVKRFLDKQPALFQWPPGKAPG
jgi:2-(1,2-epoxy-1,2-dihydrophenyl)acetyl-CoA isomerase